MPNIMYSEINNIEDCLSIINANPLVIDILNTLPDADRKQIIDDYHLKAIIQAVNMLPETSNEEKLDSPWIPNFNDENKKYILWPGIYEDSTKPNGFGLLFGAFVNTFSITGAGSRLTFRSYLRAKFVFEKFQELVEAVYFIHTNTNIKSS